MAYAGEELNAIIGDVGTSISKFGFSGEDAPKLLFGGQIGKVAGDDAFCVTENELSRRRAGLAVTHAVQNGLWADWDAVESLWARAFDLLRAKEHREHSVFAAEAAWAEAAQREKFTQLMFEKFDVPALYIAPK
jgi:actin-related protein